MKKLIFIGLMLAGLQTQAARIPNTKIPKPVLATFHKNFAGVREAAWEFEQGHYEATFKLDGQKVSATFDKEGNWLETEKRVANDALPSDAVIYIEKNCKGKPIQKVYIINMASGETNYEAKVQGKDYVFDSKGKFLKIEKD